MPETQSLTESYPCLDCPETLPELLRHPFAFTERGGLPSCLASCKCHRARQRRPAWRGSRVFHECWSPPVNCFLSDLKRCARPGPSLGHRTTWQDRRRSRRGSRVSGSAGPSPRGFVLGYSMLWQRIVLGPTPSLLQSLLRRDLPPSIVLLILESMEGLCIPS